MVSYEVPDSAKYTEIQAEIEMVFEAARQLLVSLESLLDRLQTVYLVVQCPEPSAQPADLTADGQIPLFDNAVTTAAFLAQELGRHHV